MKKKYSTCNSNNLLDVTSAANCIKQSYPYLQDSYSQQYPTYREGQKLNYTSTENLFTSYSSRQGMQSTATIPSVSKLAEATNLPACSPIASTGQSVLDNAFQLSDQSNLKSFVSDVVLIIDQR